MNQSEHPHIKKWADKESEKIGIKLHPQTISLVPIVDELIGRVEVLEALIASSVKVSIVPEFVHDGNEVPHETKKKGKKNE